jgi:phospholipid/cholesterol/gamma-HCH transport system ATP-binding protein
MGRDKALLPFQGTALAAHIAGQVRLAAGCATLIGEPERYSPLGFPVLPDLYPGEGPLGGILTALLSSEAEYNLIVACDMPSLEADFLLSLFSAAESASGDCFVPVFPGGGPAPLCAIYRPAAIPKLQRIFAAGVRKIQTALESLQTVYHVIEDPRPLSNMNTPAEWESHVQTDQHPHYLEFRHVYKTFDYPVLVDCSFYVDPGETVAIIGRSGVGKSVALAHIMGFLKPDQGQVIVAYQDITNMAESELREIRKRVTMVFQSGALFDSLTVAENILFSMELREDYDSANKDAVVNGLLKMVDLAEYADSYPTDLSTGYKRAVAIARALAAQPECILYDEPTTMVDPIMSDHLGSLMVRLKHQLKLTSVVVTHDLDLMRKVADRVVFLYEGQVIYFGPVSGLENSKHPHIREFLAMDNVDVP